MPPSALQYEVYRIAAPVLALVLAVELAIAWRRQHRANPATRIFSFFVLATMGYLLTNLAEISTRSEAACYSWSRLMYLFIVFIPPIWLGFALRLTTGKSIARWEVLVPLLAVPVATLVVIFSGGLVHLMWPSLRYMRVGGYVVSSRSHGPWFWLYAVYTYGVCLLAAAIIIRATVLRRHFYRVQSVWVLLGVLIPIAASLLYLLRPIPGLVKDYTPAGYALGATCFFLALYRANLFTIVPVARDLLVERLHEGIIVVDAQRRVVDINPAAFRILGLDESAVGRSLLPPPGGKPSPPEAVLAAVEHGTAGEFSTTDGPAARHYSVESIPLHRRRRSRGRLIVIQDETKVRELLARVETMAREDGLTGLLNRRSFVEAAAASFSLAVRHGEPLCAAMFDLDEFKGVNDRHGHAAGDLVLQRFARVLSEELRDSDLSCRHGGEEFAALLPHTGVEGALKVCERVRVRFADEECIAPDGLRVRATVSAGVAAFEPGQRSLETLLAAADAALYRAKAGGRNCVRGPRPEP